MSPDNGRDGAPTGQVTFWMTDVVGSTRAWVEDPDWMDDALSVHDAIVADSIRSHGGYRPPDQGEGDSVMAAFAEPTAALACAVEAQRRLVTHRWQGNRALTVRMAVHRGPVVLRAGNYKGLAVNSTARLRGLAAGAQILCSADVAGVVEPDPPTTLHPVGSHQLRDLDAPVSVFAVRHPDLPDVAVTARPRRRGTAPTSSLPLVGRQEVEARIDAALSRSRLVTLVGPPGIGKTALLLQCAAGHEGDAWLVDLSALAPTSDRKVVEDAFLTGLGAERQSRVSLQNVAAALPETALVVVDECEHVLPAATAVVRDILASSTARVIATSRQRLALSEEFVVSVPPLPTGAADGGAEALFTERAEQAGHHVGQTPPEVITRLCELVDGLPLGVELAAALSVVIPPERLMEDLARQALYLGPVGANRGIENALARSYELLTREDARVFRALSVFPSAWTTSAAVSVVGPQARSALIALVDRHLVSTSRGRDEMRLLNLVRGFAGRMLEAEGEAEEVERAFESYLTATLNVAADAIHGPDGGEAARAAGALLEDSKVAVARALDRGAIDAAAAVAVAAAPHWQLQGQWGPAAEIFTALLEHLPSDPRVVLEASTSRRLQSTFDSLTAARSLAERAMQLAPDDVDLRARAIVDIAHTDIFLDRDAKAAEERLRGELEAVRRGAAPHIVADYVHTLAQTVRIRGRSGEAAALFEEAMSFARAAGDRRQEAASASQYSLIDEFAGRYDLARARLCDTIEPFVEYGDARFLMSVLERLASLDVLVDAVDDALLRVDHLRTIAEALPDASMRLPAILILEADVAAIARMDDRAVAAWRRVLDDRDLLVDDTRRAYATAGMASAMSGVLEPQIPALRQHAGLSVADR